MNFLFVLISKGFIKKTNWDEVQKTVSPRLLSLKNNCTQSIYSSNSPLDLIIYYGVSQGVILGSPYLLTFGHAVRLV